MCKFVRTYWVQFPIFFIMKTVGINDLLNMGLNFTLDQEKNDHKLSMMLYTVKV